MIFLKKFTNKKILISDKSSTIITLLKFTQCNLGGYYGFKQET